MTISAECTMLGIRLLHAREAVLEAWELVDQMKRGEGIQLTPPAESFLSEAQETYRHPEAQLTPDEIQKLDELVKGATVEIKGGRLTEATIPLGVLRNRITDSLFQKVVACECKK